MDQSYKWYSTLIKPSWSPPSWVFGPVWSVLYLIIIFTYGTVFYKASAKQIPWVVIVPFVLNLIFNFLFTTLQFGLKNNLLAMVDILLVLVTLIWAMISIWPHYKWIALFNIPYLLWVCFATVLQITITNLNK